MPIEDATVGAANLRKLLPFNIQLLYMITFPFLCHYSHSILFFPDAPKNITTQVNGRSQWEIKEGDWVSLTCGSSSNPEASYTWYKRDQGEDEAFNTKNGSLLFQSISPSASGFYKCTATNYLGNLNTETVEIRVQCKKSLFFTLLISPCNKLN